MQKNKIITIIVITVCLTFVAHIKASCTNYFNLIWHGHAGCTNPEYIEGGLEYFLYADTQSLIDDCDGSGTADVCVNVSLELASYTGNYGTGYTVFDQEIEGELELAACVACMWNDGVWALVVESIDLPTSENVGGYSKNGRMLVTYLCVEGVIAHEIGHLMGIPGDYTSSSPGYDPDRIMNASISGNEDRMIQWEKEEYLD